MEPILKFTRKQLIKAFKQWVTDHAKDPKAGIPVDDKNWPEGSADYIIACLQNDISK